jgi:hypothetical protein
MCRRRAIDVAGLWFGLVHTEPGTTSGWHHHGDHETSLYVVSGAMRLEFGPGGQSVVDAGLGERRRTRRARIDELTEVYRHWYGEPVDADRTKATAPLAVHDVRI